MAANIFGGRVHDDIDTEVERPLQPRRPGIIANGDRAGGPRAFRNLFDIDNLEQRIRGGLDPDEPRFA